MVMTCVGLIMWACLLNVLLENHACPYSLGVMVMLEYLNKTFTVLDFVFVF